MGKFVKMGFIYSFSLLIMVLFQNCDQGFAPSQSSNSQNVLGNSSDNINVNSNPNVVSTIPDLGIVSNQFQEQQSVIEQNSTITQPQNTLFNFVAGDKASCEASVQNRLGEAYTCVQGGGCGISCGMPGSNCMSANPQHFGLCVELNNNNQIINVSMGSQAFDPQQQTNTQNYNIVAGDKATCERSVLSTLGQAYSCVQGGGCGISCGIPGGNCMSANPQHFGLCAQVDGQRRILAVSSGSQPIQPSMSTKQLYNFVAGDKATCEASISNRLGISANCSRGGGCGISCGMPGGNCMSANPQHFGACILH